MKRQFEKIYENGEWGIGSGEGSLPVHVRGYIKMLEHFIRKNKIKRIIDFGCGDWQFSRYINWNGIQYIGFDVVDSVIDYNRTTYTKDNVSFKLFSGQYRDLPDADLMIVKDVLQHWSSQDIMEFLPILHNYPHCLITNCINPHGITVNQDITNGEFRHLDLRQPPFNLNAKMVYSFANYQPMWQRLFEKPRWVKNVLYT